MNACVAKNFGGWTEKVGHPCPTFMAHPTRVGRRVRALHKKLGHPWATPTMANLTVQTSKKTIKAIAKREASPASLDLHGTLSAQIQGCDIFPDVDDNSYG